MKNLPIQLRWLAPAIAIATGVATSPAQAATVTLPLGTETSGAYIEGYFDGGTDSQGAIGTNNLGLGFSNNATVQKAGTKSTSDGRFEQNPSGQAEILYFSATNASNTGGGLATGSYLNDAGGFSAVSFNYSATTTETVTLWSGVNGTGTLLDTMTLGTNNPISSTGCTTHADVYCTWSSASAANLGTAESVSFGAISSAENMELDGLNVTPVPLPPGLLLFLSGGVAAAATFARKGRQAV
jgi:hypothetical protein